MAPWHKRYAREAEYAEVRRESSIPPYDADTFEREDDTPREQALVPCGVEECGWCSPAEWDCE